MPFVGYRSSMSLFSQGTSAYYWSSTTVSTDVAYALPFDSINVFQQSVQRIGCYSLRCFKDSPTSTLTLHPDG